MRRGGAPKVRYAPAGPVPPTPASLRSPHTNASARAQAAAAGGAAGKKSGAAIKRDKATAAVLAAIEDAQAGKAGPSFKRAYKEIEAGHKSSHWSVGGQSSRASAPNHGRALPSVLR